MSGVPIPENALPCGASTGGKLAGIRKMVVGIPASPRISQKAVPWRRFSTVEPPSGISHEPIAMERADDSTLAIDR